ncbi:MAG: hypothetical protein ABEJ91_02310 [Candidatus Nanohaloarchaea archaeon]
MKKFFTWFRGARVEPIKWTFIGMMVVLGVALAFNGLVPSLISISAEIDDSLSGKYRKGVVLENLVSLDAGKSELGYNYRRRRALIPIQFFRKGGPVSYSRDGGNCYIDRVAGLDGKNYGFYVRPTVSGSFGLDCTGPVNPASAISSPVLLVRENAEAVPAKVYVYALG